MKAAEFGVDPRWAKERRMTWLKGWIETLRDLIQRDTIDLARARKSGDDFEIALIELCTKDRQEKLGRMEREFRTLRNPPLNVAVTESEIQAAKDYPLEKYLDVARGHRIICPWHKGSSATMLIKGYSYCFTCNQNADTLKFVMFTEGLDFVSAVRHINGA